MMERKLELSWLNVLFCLSVILIHVLSDSLTTLDPTSWQYLVVLLTQILAKAAVPGFFFLSGIKLCLNPPTSYKRFYLKKLKTILVPYLIAVTVYYLIYVSLGWYPLDLSLLLKFMYNGRVGSHFYFIVCLVQFFLLAPLWMHCVKRFHPIIVLPTAILISRISEGNLNNIMYLLFPNMDFLGSDRIFTTYLGYFLTGCYIGHNYMKAQDLLHKNRFFIFGSFIFFTAISLVSFGMSTRLSIPGLNDYFYAYSFFCFLALFLLAQKLPKLPKPIALLDKISYHIFLYHMVVVVLYTTFVPATYNMGLDLLLRVLFVYLISISLCIIWHFALRKIRLTERIKKHE